MMGWDMEDADGDARLLAQPQLLLRENVNLAAATYGGLITGMRRNGTRITTGPLRDILRM